MKQPLTAAGTAGGLRAGFLSATPSGAKSAADETLSTAAEVDEALTFPVDVR